MINYLVVLMVSPPGNFESLVCGRQQSLKLFLFAILIYSKSFMLNIFLLSLTNFRLLFESYLCR